MTIDSSFSASETHEVFNQPTPLENYNAYESDAALKHWMTTFNGDFAKADVSQYGHHVGHELIEAGFLANQNKPEFHSHDRFGNRIDLAKFHPAYHQLMRTAIEAGAPSFPWTTSSSDTAEKKRAPPAPAPGEDIEPSPIHI